MTEKDLASIIEKAQAEGAPPWGVSLIVSVHQIRADFGAHVTDHTKRAAPWEKIRDYVMGALTLALVLWLLNQAPAILQAAR